MRILIDSVYISTGGGLILFNYLVSKLVDQPGEIHYLIDTRNSTHYPEALRPSISRIEAKYWNRHRFYLDHKEAFDIVFTFNNLPPSIKMSNTKVLTYFHQDLYLNTSNIELTLKNKLLFVIKKLIFQWTLKNTNIFCVQTPRVKSELHRKYGVKEDNIQVLPFYEDEQKIIQGDIHRNDFGFIYISDGQGHKNHKRLLKAWKIVNSVYPHAKLTLTVSQERFPELNMEIKRAQDDGLNVSNVGFLGQRDMYNLYRENRFLVYPSLAESFGLGLIEASQFDCEILASNLDYVREVVEPRAVFNPLDFNDIANVVLTSLKNNNGFGRTRKIVENQIDDLIRSITLLN